MILAIIFNIIIILLLIFSFFKNKKKSLKALHIAFKSFKQIFPLLMIIFFILIFIQGLFSIKQVGDFISSKSGFLGYIISASVGAFFHVPPFIAFPLGGQLLRNGVNAGTIAVFITSLVMVHTFSIPIEIKELGLKFALIRNALAFAFAILIGILIGVLY